MIIAVIIDGCFIEIGFTIKISHFVFFHPSAISRVNFYLLAFTIPPPRCNVSYRILTNASLSSCSPLRYKMPVYYTKIQRGFVSYHVFYLFLLFLTLIIFMPFF